MTDDFADGWIDFEEEVDRIKGEHNLSLKNLKEYFKCMKKTTRMGSKIFGLRR